MRNRLAVITCLLGIALAASDARAQTVAWVNRMGGNAEDSGSGIAVDGDGNTYVTGSFRGTAAFGSYSLTSAGNYDIFVAKLDSSGTVQWAKRMGGASGVDSGSGIAVDGGGNAYVTGHFEGTTDFGSYSLTSAGLGDIFVTKLDSGGTVQWAKRMGSAASYDRGLGIVLDGGANAYVTGYFWGTADFGSYSLTSAGADDIFVTKLDGSGTVLWAKGMGGDSDDRGYEIAVVGSGITYVTGDFQGTATFGLYRLESAGSTDIFVTKLDSSGTVQWAKRMGGTSTDRGSGIAVGGGGNAHVTGSFRETVDFGSYSLTSTGSTEIFVTKLDSGGTVQWAKRMGGTSSERGNDIAVDGGGNAYVTGAFRGTAAFGSHILTSAGLDEIFVAELDSNGTVEWAKRMGGVRIDFGFGIAVDGDGNAYVTGRFEETADFGSYLLTSAGSTDIFVLKLLGCGYFVDQSIYGRLLFPPLCTRDASNLTQDVYDSTTIGIHSGDNDASYLSSDGMSFAPLVVDDAVHYDGQDVGLGPYAYQPGVPPFVLNLRIENNLIPLPAHKIPAEIIAEGSSEVLFELLDTQREIYGNTALYLVRDCGIYLEKGENTTLHWVSHDVEIEGFTSNLDVVSGVLSELLEDQGFSRSCFLGAFVDTTQMIDPRPDPSFGQGYYYLVSGTCAQPIGYGISTAGPRGNLGTAPACP